MTSKSWMGSIKGIELEWHEGVFIETLASAPALVQTVHGPMTSDQPVGVYYDAKCCLCEWAYAEATDMPLLDSSESVSYGHKTPDLEGIMGWVKNHRVAPSHERARRAFRDLEWKNKKEKKG